jgi:hypothetical protein
MSRGQLAILTTFLALVVNSDLSAQKAATNPVATQEIAASGPDETIRKPTSQEQRRKIVFDILEEAHTAAAELSTEQRLPILKEICWTAFASTDRLMARVPTANTRTRSRALQTLDRETTERLANWAEELYQLANDLPQGSYAKLDAQSAAVRSMVPVDDNRALEMLDGLESSDTQAGRQAVNNLAIFVFTEALSRRGDAAVPELRTRAQSLGESGQYPYDAMAAVMGRIGNKKAAQAIFLDALTAFQHADENLNSMLGMLSITRAGRKRRVLEPWQAHEGAVAITDRLKAEIAIEQKAYEHGKQMRPGLSIIVKSMETGLREIDPVLAATLPSLPPYKPVVAQATVSRTATPKEAPSPELQKQQEEFGKTSIRLMELSESEVHGGPELQQVIDKGVDQAATLLHTATENAKDHASALVEAMPRVTDFIQVGARTNPAMTLAAVRKVQDSEIRARMLVTITVGLPDPNFKGW